MNPARDNISPAQHAARVAVAEGRALPVPVLLPRERLERTLAVREIVKWFDAGAGSGSHLAEKLGIPVSREARALANILQCAKDSPEVQRMLADLAFCPL